jgi:hypothetical protein
MGNSNGIVDGKHFKKEIMKNIHILPTDQPSRLVKIKDTFFITSSVDIPGGTFYNIYITSLEEIKEGVNQWYLDKFLNKPRNSGGAQYGEKQNIIILTTDPTLIADGVQSIDDEFLKWFVKHTTCEFVEVKKKLVEFPLTFKMMYKIIIPQEGIDEELLPEFNLSKGVFDKLSNISSKEMPQEFSKLVNENFDELIGDEPKQEITYSEDEVRELLIKGLTHNDDKLCGSLVTVQKEIRTANFNVWFEEYKKK